MSSKLKEGYVKKKKEADNAKEKEKKEKEKERADRKALGANDKTFGLKNKNTSKAVQEFITVRRCRFKTTG